MRRIIVCLFLTIILIGCDYFNETRICNQTKKDITLKLTFDSTVINSWSGGIFVGNISKTFQNWGDNLIPTDIDTINYISTYLIKPDSCSQIEGGNNRRTFFHFYRAIEIISGFDTLRLQTKKQMRKAFNSDRKKPNYYFDLLIQEDGKNASR